jgi:hypothetical protein
MAQAMPPLRCIAHPRASYRGRYMCEGRPCRNRAQRFVRADNNPDGYIYPTVEVRYKKIFFYTYFNFFIRFQMNGLVNFNNQFIFV